MSFTVENNLLGRPTPSKKLAEAAREAQAEADGCIVTPLRPGQPASPASSAASPPPTRAGAGAGAGGAPRSVFGNVVGTGAMSQAEAEGMSGLAGVGMGMARYGGDAARKDDGNDISV